MNGESFYIAVVTMFLSGLTVGFFHCTGMCGPIVLGFSQNMSMQSKGRQFVNHLLYHLGRITTYSLIGGFLALISAFIVQGTFQIVQSIILFLTGTLMVLMGLATIGFPSVIKKIEALSWLNKPIKKAMMILREGKGIYYPMGLVLGFLPCGAVYTVFISAIAVGTDVNYPPESFIKGLIISLAFGIGTIPALFSIGFLGSLSFVRKKLYALSAVIMIFFGSYFVYTSVSSWLS